MTSRVSDTHFQVGNDRSQPHAIPNIQKFWGEPKVLQTYVALVRLYEALIFSSETTHSLAHGIQP
jgi:hypothetical protein